jgi:AraC family transcriptional regulator, alkane utilization regulator
MNVLNELVKSLRIKSTIYGRAEYTAPWGVQMPYFPGHAGFIVVNRGNCWLESDLFKTSLALAGGDFVLFPHGSAFQLRDKPQSKAVPLEKIMKSKDTRTIQYGGGGALSIVVHGCFEFESRETNPLIAALPKVIHIKSEEGSQWLDTTLQYLASETSSELPASETVILHLTDILFIQALRAFAKREGESCKEKNGLIYAISDPQIGQALALIHNRPEEKWTVRSLAATAGISRAGFAARFHQLVGEPPLQYLTRWRMHKASTLLRSEKLSLTQVADQVGYDADAAFNKAFKRWTGKTPGSYRKENHTAI